MITRDISGTFYVPAFDRKMFGSCAATRYDPTCGYNPQMCDGVGTERSGWNGRIIDRLALPTQFTSARAIATSFARIECCSTGEIGKNGAKGLQYIGLAVGLDHNCSTGTGWSAFSTASWSAEMPGYLLSTATSENAFLTTACATSSGLNPTLFCTSTAGGVVTAEAVFDLTAAKRFIRVVVSPRIESTGCSIQMPVEAGILFGGAVGAPPVYADLSGTLIRTSGCSTST